MSFHAASASETGRPCLYAQALTRAWYRSSIRASAVSSPRITRVKRSASTGSHRSRPPHRTRGTACYWNSSTDASDEPFTAIAPGRSDHLASRSATSSSTSSPAPAQCLGDLGDRVRRHFHVPVRDQLLSADLGEIVGQRPEIDGAGACIAPGAGSEGCRWIARPAQRRVRSQEPRRFRGSLTSAATRHQRVYGAHAAGAGARRTPRHGAPKGPANPRPTLRRTDR